MTTTDNRPPLPPVECKHWCSEHDGHTNAMTRADQACMSKDQDVPLSLERPWVADTGEEYPAHVQACLMQSPDGDATVEVQLNLAGDDQDYCSMTADEARAFAVSLLALCNEADPPTDQNESLIVGAARTLAEAIGDREGRIYLSPRAQEAMKGAQR